MTLLTICQDIADEVSVFRPTAVIGSSDSGILKLRRAATKAGYALMRNAAWLDLRKERTFTAIAGETQTGILPADFNRFVPETFWDRTNIQFVVGPVSAVEWAGLKAGSYSGVTRKFVRRGTAISVTPAFAGGESLAFEYISKNWCQSSGGTAQSAWAADTDTGILDEELIKLAGIYYYRDIEGLDVTSARAEFMTAYMAILDNENSGSRVMGAGDIFSGSRHFGGAPFSGDTEGWLW